MGSGLRNGGPVSVPMRVGLPAGDLLARRWLRVVRMGPRWRRSTRLSEGAEQKRPSRRGQADGRPRVLLLTSHPVDGRDGADKEIAVGLAHGLPGYSFTFFGRADRPPAAPGRRIPVLSRTSEPGVLERSQIAIRVPALVRRADLVHTVMTVGPWYAAWSRSVLAPRGRPTVLTVPGILSPECLAGGRPFGVTVALSAATAALLVEAGHPDVRVIPAGIDLTRWRAVDRSHNPRPVLFFAGHTDPHGGVREAVEVAAAVQRSGLQVRLVLALRTRRGQNEASERRAAAGMARAAGLDSVEVHGRVPSMTDAIAAADVVLFTPERLDGGKADVPLVLLEALATGRPVVTTRLPQLAELNDVIVQVAPRAVQDAATAVRALLADRGSWHARSRSGRCAVEKRFSAERMCQEYAKLYEELLAARRS